MRFWLSGPRILHGLVRPGISLGREDFRPHLPSWRRYELRHGLQEAAKARGEPMTREDADYAIDKSLASGLLDSSGGLNFTAKGSTREVVAGQIIERSTAWGQPVGREDAEHMASGAVAICVGIDFSAISSVTRLPHQAARSMI
jgi:hypothetical protein